MLKKYVFPIVLLCAVFVHSQDNNQLNIGLETNAQYYMDDSVTGDFLEDNRFRSNNYLKTEYGVNNFTFGIQLESYLPEALLNYSPNLNKEIGIGTYFASYKTKKIEATLGYFYEQFGSGLILRFWEDRQLGINNALRGARLKFNPSDKIDITALYGKQRVGFDVSEGSVFGLDANFDASTDSNSLQFGISYVGRFQNLNQDFIIEHNIDTGFNELTNAFSGRINYAKNNIYANIEGVFKSKDALVEDNNIYTSKNFYGNAFLLEMGYSKKGIGFTSTIRRIENMTFYSDREASGNTFNEQIINFIPALTRQQDYSLANIYVYQAQPKLSFNPLQKAGEIGFQTDFYYKIKKDSKLGGKYGTKLAVNLSSWYGLAAEYNQEFRRINTSNHIFELGERYFTDVTLEVRKKLSKKSKMIFTYINSYYNKEYIEERHGIIESNIVAVEMSHKLENKKSYRLELQHLWTQQDMKNWVAATAEFNFNTKLSAYISDMYNYGNEDPNEQNHYYNTGISLNQNQNRFSLSYGRQRGGLLCVGGVCRVVSPATGVTFSANISF